ncbi:MAG: hypothetical protein OQK79_12175 [Rhodanobacter sp.]|nr:hypothetical protein [Rhodanobacter sp.]
MKTQKLLTSIAAILLTAANLSVVNYNVETRPAPAPKSHGEEATLLAPINVVPSAEDMRDAALLGDDEDAGVASLMSTADIGASRNSLQFSVIGSQLAMPYYSFGNQFGRISKE